MCCQLNIASILLQLLFLIIFLGECGRCEDQNFFIIKLKHNKISLLKVLG
jgi:hypothetical protein